MSIKITPSQTRGIAFIIIMLVAFFLRFYRLADHPLGLFSDPSINGLDAIRIMEQGNHTLFFPTNGGRESLFIYLLIPFIKLFGTTPFAPRLLAAIISLLTVASLFAFLSDVRRNIDGINARYFLAILSTLTLAVSPWHIAISRLGLRSIMVPLIAIIAFWLFLKGWRNGQTRWFVLSGIALGLGAYTYPAARLLPLILGFAVLPEFFFKKPGQSRNLIIFTLSALLTASPMLGYFLIYPLQLSARAGSVTVWHFLHTPADITAEFGRNFLRILGFFCCQGSPNPIFGLPNYPGLPILLTPFLLIGLIVAFKNWRDLFHRWIVVWWLIGISPSIIAIEAPHPLRMVVAVVPTAILVAIGILDFRFWILDWNFKIQNYQSSIVNRQSSIQNLKFKISYLLILATVPFTFQAYFVDWPKLQAMRGIYDFGAIAIRDEILSSAKNQDLPIYLPLRRFNDPPLLFYLSGSFKRQANLTVAPSEQAIIISPEKNRPDSTWVQLYHHTATILPPLTVEGQRLIQHALANETAKPIHALDGEEVARLAYLSPDPSFFLQQPTRMVTATFGSLELMGINYPFTIALPSSINGLPITLFWRTHASIPDEYNVLIHLVNDQHQAFGNGDARPNDWAYPTTFWRPTVDEIAAEQHVKIEVDSLSPGRYWLALSVYNPLTAQRLPLKQNNGDSPNTLFIGPLKVPLPIPSPFPATAKKITTFGNLADLVAATVETPSVSSGQAIQLNLWWQALSTPPLDYTVFVHLLDSADHTIYGHDAQPVNGSYPTTIWSAGEPILDQHNLPIAADIAPGTYRLAIGLYHQPTGQRLPIRLPDGRMETDEQFILEQVIEIRN